MFIQKTAAEIAELVHGTLEGECAVQLTGVSSLSEAGETDVSFLGNEKYRDQVLPSRASLVLVPENYDAPVPAGRAWLRCADPSNAFTLVIGLFTPPPVQYPRGIHPTAVIEDGVEIAPDTCIGPGVVVCAGAKIGQGTTILANSFIGQQVVIGEDSFLYPNVVVRERCLIGNRVILHAGVVIGGDGFGYQSGPDGHHKIPQVGIVQIDDDVEIGCNSTVDRARFGRTWIKAGTKIDNLVQVGHNVEIGYNGMIVAQVGIAGSTRLGNFVTMAGQSATAGHLTIGDGAIVMGQSGVSKNLPPKAIVMGTPAMDRLEFAKQAVLIRRVEKLGAQLKELQAELKKLQG